MKKKTNWKTAAGLAAGAALFLKFAEDLPSGTLLPEDDAVSPDIKPDCGPGKKPQRFFDTSLDRWSWRCVPETETL